MESPPYLPSHNSIISLSHPSSSPWLGRTNSVAGDVHVYARRYVRSCDPLWVTISRPGSIGDDGGSRVVRPGTFPHWWSWGSKPWGLPPKMGQTCPPKKFSSSNGIENLRGELPISGKTVMFSFFFLCEGHLHNRFFCWTIVSKKGWGGSGNTQKKWVLCRCFPFSKERIFRWTSCSFSGSVCLLYGWFITYFFRRIRKKTSGSKKRRVDPIQLQMHIMRW